MCANARMHLYGCMHMRLEKHDFYYRKKKDNQKRDFYIRKKKDYQKRDFYNRKKKDYQKRGSTQSGPLQIENN